MTVVATATTAPWSLVVQTLLGLIVFLALVALGLIGLQAGGSVPQATILLLSAGVGLGVWSWQEKAKQTHDLETKLGSDKKALYKLYLDVLREVVEKGGKMDARDTEKYVKRLRAFAFSALLIGSDEVVLAHDRFLNAGRVGENMPMAAIADVILAMRRDAGEDTTNLQLIDVLAVFIKAEDVDDFKPACDQWNREKAKAWPVRGHAAKS